MLREYEANIENDGFSRSIRSAIRYLNMPSRMVVITNLSMGLLSLLNNARIAKYYGHKVSVVLMPHTWHEEKEQAYIEINKAVHTLKANGIDAIAMRPGERPDNVIKRGGLGSVKVRVRR
jgi:predicted Fe-Mo cluster-binding NifX family protein